MIQLFSLAEFDLIVNHSCDGLCPGLLTLQFKRTSRRKIITKHLYIIKFCKHKLLRNRAKAFEEIICYIFLVYCRAYCLFLVVNNIFILRRKLQ